MYSSGMYFDFDKLINAIKEESLSLEELNTIRQYVNMKIASMTSVDIVNEWLETYPTILNRQVSEVYSDFTRFCVDRQSTVLSTKALGIILATRVGVKSKVKNINGKSARIYVRN